MTFKDIKEKLEEKYTSLTGKEGDQVLYELNFSDISQILTNSSFLFYEFEDKKVECSYDEADSSLGNYTKRISPLFIKKIVSSPLNNELLNIIDEELPLYHLQPEELPEDLDLQELSSTRDCGINNTHAVLRESSYYQIWLRDVFGYIQNELLLNAYNKLRWPILNENQYIMADLFPSLALNAFNSDGEGGEENTDILIKFRESTEENEEDNNFTEQINGEDSSLHTKVGGIDYLNEIVEKKLSSVYEILDYHPGRVDALTSWAESLYESGQIAKEDLEKQVIIYKLQDVKYELLKRKYAGTKTLYSMVLASLNRQGSFVSAVPLSSVTTKNEADDYFIDKRLIRIINLPGITTSLSNVNIFPMNYIPVSEYSPSINDVASLYYNSGQNYNAEEFYSTIKRTFSDGNDNQVIVDAVGGDTGIRQLRKNIQYINWNHLQGVSRGQLSSVVYSTLDERRIDSEAATEDGKIYTRLDTRNPEDKNGNPLYKNAREQEGEALKAEYSFMDYSTPSIDFTAESNIITKDIVDVNADRLLFNENALQKELRESYPYVTYSIASGNSISLMDSTWLDYIQTSIETKSKVQEDITYGAQLNKYYKFEGLRQGEYSFFAISFSGDKNPDFETLDDLRKNPQEYKESMTGEGGLTEVPYPKYTYLWYCTVKYEVETFKVQSFDRILISRIVNKLEEYDSSFKGIEEYEELKSFSRGVLPFTYFKLSDEKILNLKYGIFENDWYDDINRAGYEKASFLFSSCDFPYTYKKDDLLEGIAGRTFKKQELLDLTEEDVTTGKRLSSSPIYRSAETKSIYYVVKKGNDSYVCSDPIRVFNLSKVNFEEGDTFYPDWYDICYFLNPSLNFTRESASPLRGKRVISTESARDNGVLDTVDQVSDNIYLSNLTRFRGKDFLCADENVEENRWVRLYEDSHPARKYSGFYLKKNSLEIPGDEEELNNRLYDLEVEKNVVAIYGDPRGKNLFDLKTEYDGATTGQLSSDVRTKVFTSKENGIKCLHFESKIGESENQSSTIGTGDYTYEYFTLEPPMEEYSTWWWNKGEDTTIKEEGGFDYSGISIFINFSPDIRKEDVERTGGIICLLEREGEFNLSLTNLSIDNSKNIKGKVSFTYNGIVYKTPSNFAFTKGANTRLGATVVKGRKPTLILNDTILEINNDNNAVIESIYSKEGCKNPIYLGISSDEKSHYFLGEIYDLRLYNRGVSEEELHILNQGSFRELYSYSPESYVLGYNIYVDIGVLKEVGPRLGDAEGIIDEVTGLRAFNRSVWDSILVDRCPVTLEEVDDESPFYRKDVLDPLGDSDVYGWIHGEKALKNCVEINLGGFEAINNTALRNETGDNLDIKYYGKDIKVDVGDRTSIVNTLIYPVTYNKDIIRDSNVAKFYVSARTESEDTIVTGTTGDLNTAQGLILPKALTSMDGNLKYEADLNLNFTIDTYSNFANYYSKGSNIILKYNNVLGKAVVARSEEAVSTSANNHILIPITVPKQYALTADDIGCLDRFYLSGVELNNGINTLLRATSYYNELRIPVAMDVVSNGTHSTLYASKWDAIRTLKEGTYYITCKYPFQLLPFTDAQHDVVNKAKYNYLYASVRFKIEVSGTPVVYGIGENGAEDITSSYISAYNKENIASTLKSTAALLNPVDNRTFPHRKINIDLYVQECSDFAGRMQVKSDGSASEGYDYSWKLLGTNHPDDYKSSDDWIYLTKQKLENNLTITSEIPLFFSKNFTSPFFIAKSEKRANGETRVNSTSADDDLIDPIRINPIYNGVKLISYIKAIGVAEEGKVYYVKDGSSYYVASTQPIAGASLEGETVYYIRHEGLDNLQVEKEKDLDNLALVAGRSYKVLWDYTGCVSEVSFTDKIYSEDSVAKISLASATTPTYNMSDSEKRNYARLSSLRKFDSISSFTHDESDYAYTENGMGYRFTDAQLVGRTSGYKITRGEYVDCYIYSGLSSEEELTPEFVKSLRTSPSTIMTEIAGNYYLSKIKASLISYEVKTVGSESDIPSTIGSNRVYKVSGGDKYYFDSKSTYVPSSKIGALDLSNLDESSWNEREIGSFYRSEDSDKLFRFGIALDNIVFKCGGSYFVWDLFNRKRITVDESTYSSSGYCPQDGNSLMFYPSTTNGLGYRFVNSEAPHFTEITSKRQGSEFDSNAFYFGNPYSRASSKNYLLKIRDVASSCSRNNIVNSWYFSYVPTEVPENQYLSASLLTAAHPLNVKVSSVGDTSQVTIDEEKIIRTQHNNIWSSVQSAITTLTGEGSSSGSSGIFTALSTIRPAYHFDSSSESVCTESYIRDANEDLISYLASDRIYPSKNEDIKITRRSLYSNNLITNQDFDNANYWSWGDANKLLGFGVSNVQNSYSKNYVSDIDWDEGVGKDVCEIVYYGTRDGQSSDLQNPLAVRYSKGGTAVGYTYEAALNIKVLNDAWVDGNWSSTNPIYYRYILNEEGTKYVLTDCTSAVVCLDYWPSNNTYEVDTIVVRKDILEARLYSKEKDQKTEILTLCQYEKGESIDKPQDSEKEEALKNTIYVDVRANRIRVEAVFLAKGKQVGTPVQLRVSSVSQQDNSSLNGLVAFDNQWYTVSAEPDESIVADSVVFVFKCREAVKFRITKAVIRASDAQSHALGLSDSVRTKGTSGADSTIPVTSYHCISYRNKSTKELTPIQFNAILGQRISSSSYASSNIYYPVSGLSNAMSFIQAYSLGYEASNNKVEILMNPWKRRLYYKRKVSERTQDVYFDETTGLIYEEYYNTSSESKGYCFRKEVSPSESTYYYFLNGVNEEVFEYNSAYTSEGGAPKYIRKDEENGRYYTYQKKKGIFTILSRVPFDSEIYFHKYEVRMDSRGIKTESENSLAISDLYKNPVFDFRDGGDRNYIVVTNLTLDKSGSSFLGKYSTNLKITKDSKSYGKTGSEKIISMGPLSITNAKISALTNCFDYEKYKNKETNNVAVTNLQLLGSSSEGSKKVLFEIEYPPVIYREGDQHLSVNILLQRGSTSKGSDSDGETPAKGTESSSESA